MSADHIADRDDNWCWCNPTLEAFARPDGALVEVYVHHNREPR